jgi:hypothetical protein
VGDTIDRMLKVFSHKWEGFKSVSQNMHYTKVLGDVSLCGLFFPIIFTKEGAILMERPNKYPYILHINENTIHKSYAPVQQQGQLQCLEDSFQIYFFNL